MRDDRYLLTTEQQDLRAMVRDFADKEIIPQTASIDVDKAVMNNLFKKAYDMGLTYFTLPEKYGIIASILCIIAVCFVAYPIYDVALPVILELVTN